MFDIGYNGGPSLEDILENGQKWGARLLTEHPSPL